MLGALLRMTMLTTILALGLSLAVAGGQDEAADENVDYSVFSLEELFRVQITTASKQKEPLRDAPGVVTVITAQEIEKFGGNSLWEVLDRVPGLQSVFSTAINRTTVRGDPNTSNFHTLILVDGRPLRTSSGNWSVYSPLSAFPLELIERIEIVRGPGSVLYGTNAFEGVINLITKKSKTNGITVSPKTGMNSTKGADLLLSYHIGDFSIDTSALYFDTEGWDFTSRAVDFFGTGDPLSDADGNPVYFTKGVFEDTLGLNTTISYKDLKLSYYHGNIKQFTEVFFNGDTVSYRSKVDLLDLGYTFKHNDNWRTDVNLTHNREDFKFTWDDLGGNPVETLTEDYLVEATVHGKIGENLNVLIGGVYQRLTGDSGGALSQPFSFESDAYSAYTQLNYRYNRFLKFIAGTQFNRVDNADSDFVPRFGAVVNFSPRLGAKLLFGEAFRSATATERLINTPGFQLGFPGLKSESIKTISTQFFYQGDREQIILTLYKNKEKGLIRLVTPSQEYYPEFSAEYPNLSQEDFLAYGLIFRNLGELEQKGLEFEAKYVPTENWYIMGAFTYQQNDDGVIDDVTLQPDYTVKIGVGYSDPKFSFAVYNSYYDAFKDNIIINPDRVLLNPPSEAYSMMTAHLGANLVRKKDFNLTFECYGYNLLDEDVYVHELPTFTFNTVPGASDRSVYSGLKARF